MKRKVREKEAAKDLGKKARPEKKIRRGIGLGSQSRNFSRWEWSHRPKHISTVK